MPSLIRPLSLGSFLAAYQIEVRAQTGGRSTRGFLILEDPDVRGKDHKRADRPGWRYRGWRLSTRREDWLPLEAKTKAIFFISSQCCEIERPFSQAFSPYWVWFDRSL
ncbi:uncharacterized protein ARMOST_13370 [Armillaria ostoyae]|uniref:Uncharacterized protein n=1 Tax=Armillaria ostoyae TaxID=47428 RepID=A0A284RMM0_ARMOS|nr:uncharacterized protein ARMOST_13370 [Armillaria ostoyae]